MSFKDQVKWAELRIRRGEARKEVKKWQSKVSSYNKRILDIEAKYWLENKKKKGKKAKL